MSESNGANPDGNKIPNQFSLSDTIGTETIRLDLDGLYNEIMRDNSGNEPLNRKNLGLEDKQDILSTLTKKPPEKYHFRKSIGHGGMKVVMQVKDRDTTRDIAMALLPDAESRPKQDILRFIEEARITATLEHPNIVPVHDIGIDSAGSPYFTMKLLRGETLASVLKKLEAGDSAYLEKYPLEKLLRVFLKICNAIAFAHSKGVLHLDVKPENIQLGDFGEVVVMDWGLARVISELPNTADDSKNLSETKKRKILEEEGVTLDGVRKGTPGYMAPEQAAGRNSEKDFRTDIYALGAILYSMLTYVNPITSKTVKEMLLKTVHGNIVPPKKRAPENMIPSALEAVVMKAMALKPQDRYQTVRELRNEVYSFLSGYATKAERATIVKKSLLLYRRHRISVLSATAAVLLALIALSYAAIDFTWQRGDWIRAFERDFTKPETSLAGLQFRNSTLQTHVPVWRAGADGLDMGRMEWLCLPDLGTRGNVRVVAELQIPSTTDVLEVCLNSKEEILQEPWQTPSGYSFQLAAYGGSMDSIYKNDRPGSSELFAAADSNLVRGTINKIVFERVEGKLSIRENGKLILSASDLFPITGKGFDRIFLRTFATSGMKLRKLSIYRLALPKKASPVVAGDALFDARHYEDAVEKYLTIADDYRKDPIAEVALAKAYMAAASQIRNPEKRSAMLMGIKSRISSRFPSFRYSESILELDILMLWRNGSYKDAQTLIDDLFATNPRTGIVKRLLHLPHKVLPGDVQEILMRHIVRTRNLTRLNLSGMGISSLNALSGMKLSYLDCTGNALKNLDGIKDMPLEVLLCTGNRIENLNPLQGNRTLKMLFCEANRIEDLSPLSGTRLTDLNCSENRIKSLKPLKDLPLERLIARENRITDLAPLKGSKVKRLDIGLNPVRELSPLAELPLEILKLDRTEIFNLAALKGMPLTVLGLWGCASLNDLTPLASIPTLEVLSIPANLPYPESIRNLPNLQYVTDESALPSSEQETPDIFRKKKRTSPIAPKR